MDRTSRQVAAHTYIVEVSRIQSAREALLAAMRERGYATLDDTLALERFRVLEQAKLETVLLVLVEPYDTGCAPQRTDRRNSSRSEALRRDHHSPSRAAHSAWNACSLWRAAAWIASRLAWLWGGPSSRNDP